jgi:ribosomal-protein-alanine N-acetyltransferase
LNRLDTGVRIISLTDAEAIAAHVSRDAKELARWDPARAAEYYTTAGQARRIERLLARCANGELWPGVILAHDVVIGQITVQSIVRGSLRKASLGYWIASAWQSAGHATRAVGLSVEMMAGELSLHRAEAFTQVNNIASQRVLSKNGFTSCGLVHSHIFIDGSWRDEMMWERLLDGAVAGHE